MNDFLSQLNLTAQERRIVVAIGMVVIIVLNLLFVWPHFSDWGRINSSLKTAYDTIAKDNRLIMQDRNPTNGFQKKIAKLARQEGGSVMEQPVDPQIQLNETIRSQSRKAGVMVESYNPGSVKTNEFFEEHTTVISVSSQEPQLVDFLYGMGNDPSMIRVGKLDLKPADQNRYRLRGSITLTANYQKSTASKVSGASTSRPGARPATPATPLHRSGIPESAAPGAHHAPGGPPRPGANPAAGRPPTLAPGTRRAPVPGSMPYPKPIPGPPRPGQKT